MLRTALHFSHQLLTDIVEKGDTVIDATMGNGNDTLFLAKLVDKTGKVYAFDVQKQAVENTATKLGTAYPQATLFLAGHEEIDQKLSPVEKIKAAIFNLGYLPKSDKSIITQEDTTLPAMKAVLNRLLPTGRMILVIYYGHPGGEQEKNAVLNFCSQLPQEDFSVLTYQFINQKNNPPILVCVEKK